MEFFCIHKGQFIMFFYHRGIQEGPFVAFFFIKNYLLYVTHIKCVCYCVWLYTFHEFTNWDSSTSCSSLLTVLMCNILHLNSKRNKNFHCDICPHTLLIFADRLASIRSYDDMPIVSANVNFVSQFFSLCFVCIVVIWWVFFLNQQREPETQNEDREQAGQRIL